MNISRVCGVCNLVSSRYSCPRCNIAYCSARCYGDHGGVCTELFFRTQVAGEESLQGVDDNVRRKTLAALLVDRAEGMGTKSEGENKDEDRDDDDDIDESSVIPIEARDTLRLLALALEAAEARAADDGAAGRDDADSRAAVESAIETLDRALPPAARRAFLRAVASGTALADAGTVADNPWWVGGVNRIIIVQEVVRDEEGVEERQGEGKRAWGGGGLECRKAQFLTPISPLPRAQLALPRWRPTQLKFYLPTRTLRASTGGVR